MRTRARLRATHVLLQTACAATPQFSKSIGALNVAQSKKISFSFKTTNATLNTPTNLVAFVDACALPDDITTDNNARFKDYQVTDGSGYLG